MNLDSDTAMTVGGGLGGAWLLKEIGGWGFKYFTSRTESIDALKAVISQMAKKQDEMIEKFDKYVETSHSHDRELDVVKTEMATVKEEVTSLRELFSALSAPKKRTRK